ncbi:MAG: hypothetical protein ACR2O2_16180 [Ruegeria sp.]
MMKSFVPLLSLSFAFVIHWILPATAQQRVGWLNQVDGLATYQGSADLSRGGDFTASRAFLRATSVYNRADNTFFGVSASFGQFDYEFSQADNQPWSDIRDVRLSVPFGFRFGDTGRVFVAPQVRWDYQSGVDASDGRTYGVFGGVAWQVNDDLLIGPAFGAYTQLEDSGAEFFPALLVDWNINDRWNLNTGSGLGATQGPGLSLRYAVSDTLDLSLSARSERVRFRLDDKGLAPNGVGEDRSIPVVLALGYNPNPGVSLNVFAGAELNGRLTLDNVNGSEISSQSYETAPLVGLAFRVRF